MVHVKHNPQCIFHQNQQENETVAHILNGCHHYKGLYVARHDRWVDLVVKYLGKINQGHDCQTFKHSAVKINWFHHNVPDNDYLKKLANTTDIVIVDETLKTVLIIEVGCCFNLYMDTCYYSKLLKYQPLVSRIGQLGYQCQFISLFFGSAGHIHKNVVRGLRLGGLLKKEAKRLAKFCSVSATIGSMRIWRQRCFVYP